MAYRKPNIVNSQFVHIEQTPASVGQRILAYIIDYFVVMMAFSTMASVVSPLIRMLGETAMMYILVVVFFIPVFYAPICEQLFNGMTIGKKALGIRVVMQNGEAVSASSSFLRWVMQPIDCYLFGLGIVVMVCNRSNKRIGDLAGGTVVIKESPDYKAMGSLMRFSYITENYEPKYPFAANMTWGQINFINHTCSTPFRMNNTPEAVRNIELLANKIAGMYNIKLNPRDYNNFLCQIVSDYNYYTWHDNV